LGDLPTVLPSAGAVGRLFAMRIATIGWRIGEGIEAMADYHAAAAMYGTLSRLSDAELRRRGLSRHTLARAVCAACDRTAKPR
jgi:hypothetical protein